LRRDGGCARPGCPEDRLERLHAHHMRHWLFGGRTDLPNLVLLCDADHGLVHDLDLVMTRRDGGLIVLDPDGRRVWGRADAVFEAGLDGLASDDAQDDAADDTEQFVGVQPFDEVVGRRPSDADARSRRSCAVPAASSRRCGRRPGSPGRAASAAGCADISSVLFPDGEPLDLPDTLEAGGERMSLTWAVSVLIGNRDVARRLAAEVGLAA
jgi:hypothetical protein